MTTAQNPANEPHSAKTPGTASPWPTVLVTVLVAIFALFLIWPQFFPTPEQANGPTLANLDKRVPVLAQTSDPIERDHYGIGLSAYARSINRAIPPGARVFLSGMVGKDNASRGGYYFFIRNYLFPHDVQISLGPAIYKSDDSTWVDGVDCDSPEVLRTNGFDVFLKFGSDNQIQYIPLTEKGVPRQ